MAHGYGTSKHPGGKYRGGRDRSIRNAPRPSKSQTDRKSHDTTRNNQRQSKGKRR